MADITVEQLPEFWYLDDPPTSTCPQCGNTFPWSYWHRLCQQCAAENFKRLAEAEARFRS